MPIPIFAPLLRPLLLSGTELVGDEVAGLEDVVVAGTLERDDARDEPAVAVADARDEPANTSEPSAVLAAAFVLIATLAESHTLTA